MTGAREPEVARLVIANRQRRALEQLLGGLEPGWAGLFAGVECVFTPEASRLLREVMPRQSSEGGSAWSSELGKVSVSVTGDPAKVIELVSAVVVQDEHGPEPSVLVLDGVEVLSLDPRSEPDLVPRLPLFRMSLVDAHRTLLGLWRPSFGFSGAFTESLSKGLVVETFAGFPEEDPGSEETTYEVASWGAV